MRKIAASIAVPLIAAGVMLATATEAQAGRPPENQSYCTGRWIYVQLYWNGPWAWKCSYN